MEKQIREQMNIHDRITRNQVLYFQREMKALDIGRNMNYMMDGSGECGIFIERSHQVYLDMLFRRQGIRLRAFDGDLEYDACMFLESKENLFVDLFTTCKMCGKFTVELPEDNPYTTKYGCGHEYNHMEE